MLPVQESPIRRAPHSRFMVCVKGWVQNLVCTFLGILLEDFLGQQKRAENEVKLSCCNLPCLRINAAKLPAMGHTPGNSKILFGYCTSVCTQCWLCLPWGLGYPPRESLFESLLPTANPGDLKMRNKPAWDLHLSIYKGPSSLRHSLEKLTSHRVSPILVPREGLLGEVQWPDLLYSSPDPLSFCCCSRFSR